MNELKEVKSIVRELEEDPTADPRSLAEARRMLDHLERTAKVSHTVGMADAWRTYGGSFGKKPNDY